MVISIAMLGIGASGTFLALIPKSKDARLIHWYSTLLGASIFASYLLANSVPFDPARLSWDRIQLLYISLYYAILSFPFFCFGLIIATAFSTVGVPAGYLYAADLAGAGFGAILAFILLYAMPPERIVFIISLLPLAASLSSPGKAVKLVSLLLSFITILILWTGSSHVTPRISPYKPLPIALNYPGAEHIRSVHSPFSRIDIFKSPAARFAPGLSFRYLEPLPEQTGIAVDAGAIYAMTEERHEEKLAFVHYLPSGLPYTLSPKTDVLVLEPNAGLAVITAEQYGSQHIYAIDSNPLMISTVRAYAQQMSSTLYHNNTWSGLGRSWLRSRDKKFDIIDMSIMESLPSSSFGFAEDYRYTVEAFVEYVKKLKPDGFLCLNLYIIPPPRMELRLIGTLATAAESAGIQDASRHVAVIRSWGSLTIVMKKSELTSDDIGLVKQFSKEKRFDLVYYPDIKESESNVYITMPKNEYYHAVQQLVHRDARTRFVEDYLFDIRPVTDDKPFSHYFLKLKNIRQIYRVMGEKWQFFVEEGYLLPIQFLQVFLLSIVLIALPAFSLRKRPASRRLMNLVLPLSYFACLGIAFMVIEISFIQKMILSLETPPFAVSTVITSLLISSGIGSLLSQRVETMRRPSLLLVLSTLVLAYSFALPWFLDLVNPFPLSLRIIAVFLILVPVGLLMGIPFPYGLSLLRAFRPELIPWAWAVNGCFSVLAPIMTIMVALSTGFSTIILLGALMYLCGYLVLRGMQRKMT